MSEQAVSTTVLRYYTEAGAVKVEAVLWRWVPGDPSDSDTAAGMDVDPGLAARARALPAQFNPGLNPNRWVWIGANDAAAVLPRPATSTRGEVLKSDGTVQETIDQTHSPESAYWDYYRLPLRYGVELISEEEFRARKAEADKAAADRTQAHKDLVQQQQADREVARASARTKLAALGLSDDEVAALLR